MAVAVQRARSAAVAAPAPAPASPRARLRPPAQAVERRVRARAASPRLARSVVWIVIAAALLAGIVALNVAVLQLRMQRGRLQSEIVQVRSENSGIEAELSTAAAVGRIETAARGRLGLVDSSQSSYVKLGRRGR